MSHEQAVIALLQQELPECHFWWSQGLAAVELGRNWPILEHPLVAVEMNHGGWSLGYLRFREDQVWWEPSMGLAATRTEYADPDCIPQLVRAIGVSIAKKIEMARVIARLEGTGYKRD